ncbi:MAG TPA: phosphoribosyltransferase family protein [Candidatus Nitrosotalea sp.]|nr:phosphoribosyltransferase family protein [Candidatus Nitrosotalea sp.]
MIFNDRVDAANKLAKKLADLRTENPVILAIPRGGVVIGDVIAKELGAKLDIIVSRKIGAPDNHELAIGAVMHDGSFYPNTRIIDALNVSKEYVEQEIKSELKEIERRLMKFREHTKYEIENKTVVLVDDGIATGATILAIIEWMKKQHPKRLIVAIPVGPRDTIERLSKIVEVVVLDIPESFKAVGEFYNEFEQVEDSQVIEILRQHGYKPK